MLETLIASAQAVEEIQLPEYHRLAKWALTRPIPVIRELLDALGLPNVEPTETTTFSDDILMVIPYVRKDHGGVMLRISGMFGIPESTPYSQCARSMLSNVLHIDAQPNCPARVVRFVSPKPVPAGAGT